MRAKLCEHFEVGDWQLKKDKAHVLRDREDSHDDEMRIARMRMVEKYRHVYSLALDAKQLQAAVQALRGEARAIGVDVHRIEVEHTGGVELTVTGAAAVAQDPVAFAKAILDPANQSWARAMLAQAKQPVPGVVDVPALEDHGANGNGVSNGNGVDHDDED